MLRWISIALMTICSAVPLSAQEAMTASGTEDRPSFESLMARAASYIAEKVKDVKRLELMIAETEARTRKAQKEVQEYAQQLANRLEVLQFVRDHLGQSKDHNVVLVGNRRYPFEVVEANVAARNLEIAETTLRRDKKAAEAEDWQECIRAEKASLARVKNQLSNAKTVLDEQQTRKERVSQQLAVSAVVQETCPEEDLLFASDTELGRILGAIEVEVGTLEALLQMRKSAVQVDLSDVRGGKNTTEEMKGTEQ